MRGKADIALSAIGFLFNALMAVIWASGGMPAMSCFHLLLAVICAAFLAREL